MVLAFKNVGERSTTKNQRPINHLSMDTKTFAKLVNNRNVVHFETFKLFSDNGYTLKKPSLLLLYGGL